MFTIGQKSIFGNFSKITLLSCMVIMLTGRMCPAEEKDPHQLLLSAMMQFEDVQSYTCRLDKYVNKAGIRYEDLAIFVKYKKPAHYYFRWDRGVRQGREVIFATGKHNEKILAHPGGLFRFVTLHLDPEGRLAMKENRHSLKHSGLEKIMHLIEADYQRSRDDGLDTIEYIGEEYLDDRKVWVVQALFPDNQGYYANKIILYLDQTIGLPIKVSIYDWSEALVEAYVFRDLKINVGLTDRDFEPDNPDYDFYEVE